ncbi:MAG: hypothetical protein MR823_07990 [Ruminococcus sp.]|nr:hypothetical protein [Ruminococcus sp.]MDY4909668.1 hypothetical protein [Candidatus Fimenecus sp.]
MNIYRYMNYDEFENAYLNKCFKFRYPSVWKDSLESLFVKYASSSSTCKKLVNLYRKQYPNTCISDIYTDITNTVALSLQTHCQCWSTNGDSDVFWEQDKNYICLGVEYTDEYEFIDDFKINGHNIEYINDVNIDKIVNCFEKDRRLSNLFIVKDKGEYEKEEEYRLVATPTNPKFPQDGQPVIFDESPECEENLIRRIADYTNKVSKTVLCPKDVYIKLNNLEITSIRVRPDIDPNLMKKLAELLENSNTKGMLVEITPQNK